MQFLSELPHEGPRALGCQEGNSPRPGPGAGRTAPAQYVPRPSCRLWVPETVSAAS